MLVPERLSFRATLCSRRFLPPAEGITVDRGGGSAARHQSSITPLSLLPIRHTQGGWVLGVRWYATE
jgi:hypothetical protein